MRVKERFQLSIHARKQLRRIPATFGYNGFGEFIYYKHYSRLIYENGVAHKNEDWHGTCFRVIDGVMSIRKDWYVKTGVAWDEEYWNGFAGNMCSSLIKMEWLPPGRGLWAMGSDAVYERGSMPLYSCAYTDIGTKWIDDLSWLMDCLMNGVGVGFGPERNNLILSEPTHTHTYIIPDTREGWVESVRQLLSAFTGTMFTPGSTPEFKYHLVRLRGSPIKTFGGIASGPGPLKELHKTITELCYRYAKQIDNYPETIFKTDLANLIGVCVISGNVRRSAEIACGETYDSDFWHLKNYELYPERASWGWMSNNAQRLREDKDFQLLDLIGRANADGNDLGYLNLRNFPKGRIGKDDGLRWDYAEGINPCGEIPLEHREVCNLAETLPTRCSTFEVWLEACEYATMYTQTVSLLPTHHASTNAIVARNRRIGVSIIDFTGWKLEEGVSKVTSYLREGYEGIVDTAKSLAAEAGVPSPIRHTTMKPGGTVPKLAGRTSGAGHPTFKYTLRRVRIANHHPVYGVLLNAGVPHEPEVNDPENTSVFEFPIEQGPACPAPEVSIWEQAMNIVLLQREWADNAVSNTLYFKPMWELVCKGNLNFDDIHYDQESGYLKYGKCSWDLLAAYQTGKAEIVHTYNKITFDRETDDYKLYQFNSQHEEGQLEPVLAAIAPLTKSVSLLPHSAKGIYPQMPEEGLSKSEYDARVAAMPTIDWSSYFGGDGEDEKYCEGPSCEIVR